MEGITKKAKLDRRLNSKLKTNYVLNNISYPYKYCKLTTTETFFKFCSFRIIKIHYYNKGYMTVCKSLVIRLNYPKNQSIN